MPVRQSIQAPLQAIISRNQTPSLTASHSALVFASASRNAPVYQIITIIYPNAYAPISVSVDRPEQFALATDSHPTFAPSLTFTPSSEHSYIHVRYLPHGRGHHTGQLTIRSEIGSLTISLVGQQSVRLPSVQAFRAVARRAASRRASLPTLKRSVAGVLLLLIATVVCLVYAADRRFFPSIIPNSDSNRSHTKAVPTSSVPALPADALRAPTAQTAEPAGKRRKTRLSTNRNRLDEAADQLAQKPVRSRKGSVKRKRVSSDATRKSDDSDERLRTDADETAQKQPVNASEESDLERVLNQPRRDPLD